jgi:type II secretory pathway predicted ATPase ExeA
MSILFACAPEVWQDVMSEYHAFSERIGNEVALRPLTDDHLEDLISSYLRTARTNEAEKIAPFEPETLELIHQRSQGNIRQVLSICGKALDRGLDQSQETVTPELVQAILE